MDVGVEQTVQTFTDEEGERLFVVEIAETLGWKVMPLSGIGRPDMLLLRDRVVAVFLLARPMTKARSRAFDAFALAGADPHRWGCKHAWQIRKVLA